MNWFKFPVSLAGLAIAFSAFGQSVMPGEVLVKFQPSASLSAASANAVIEAYQLDFNDKINWARIKLPANMSVNQGIAYYRRLNFVQSVSANPVPRLLEVTNDPLIGQQWHVNRIKLTEAWDVTTGDPSVKIAILDTGVDLDHPDLQSQLLPGTDPGDGDNNPDDENGHGTHCAGIAAAATNNAIGGVGAGRDSKILPVKVFGNRGGIAVADGIVWAADNGANVISLSLKIGDFQALRDAVDYAHSKNVLIIAAAGNDNSTAQNFPAAYAKVMAVASSDPDDSRSGFSTYGNWVDVAAPGSNILSTTMGGNYGNSSGTSMACPLVAGVAGLVWARGGLAMTNQDVWDTITSTVDPVPGNYVIHGRVNALQAVNETIIRETSEMPPLSVDPFVGTYLTGDLNSVTEEDGNLFTMAGAAVNRLGRAAGFESTFEIDRPLAELSNFKFMVRANASRSVTGMVWLWNVNTERWDFVKALPIKTGPQTFELSLKNMSRYVDGSGAIQTRVRAHIPHRNAAAASPFSVHFDMVGMTAEYEVTP